MIFRFEHFDARLPVRTHLLTIDVLRSRGRQALISFMGWKDRRRTVGSLSLRQWAERTCT
jgi:hypothetical protein